MTEVQTKIDLDKYTKGEGLPFFKAKDMKTQRAKIKTILFREVDLPNTGDTLIMDFDYKKTRRSLPLNKTNVKKLIELFGRDVTKWTDKQVTLVKVLVNNPKIGKEVESIRIR